MNDIIRNQKKILPNKFQRPLPSLKRNKDIITKPDEGNKEVIMDKIEYVAKLNDILSDRKIYCKASVNPLTSWQKSFYVMGTI